MGVRTRIAGRLAAATLVSLLARQGLSSPTFLKLLGQLAKWAQPRPHGEELASCDRLELGRLSVSGQAGRSLACGRLVPGASPKSIMDAVESPEIVQPAARLLTMHPGTQSVSLACYETVLAPAESGSDRLAVAALVATRRSEAIETAHAKKLLSWAATLAKQPVDPYEPPGLAVLAQTAGASLLASNEALDPVALKLLRTASSKPLERLILAGHHLRSSLSPSAFTDVLTVIRASHDRARTMATIVDARQRPKALDANPGRSRPWRMPAVGAALGAVVGPPAAVVLLGLALTNTFPDTNPTSFGLSSALAVAGALFAVDVFVGEQMANRLPGLVARHASRARSLMAAYSAVFSVFVVVVVRELGTGLSPESRQFLNWSQLVAAIAALLGLGLVLRAVIATLDPARAAELFVSRRRSATERAGRRLRRIQRRSIDARSMISAAQHVRSVLSPILATTRRTISARRRGYIVVNRRRLERLATRNDDWVQGRVFLEFSATPGALVRQGSEIASLSSHEAKYPSTRDTEAASKALKIVAPRGIDRVAEGASDLVRMMENSLRDGNRSSAQRLGQCIAQMCIDFTAVGDTSLSRTTDMEVVSPVIAAACGGLIAVSEVSDGMDLALVTDTLEDILRWTPTRYGAASFVVARISTSELKSDSAFNSLARIGAKRCLETLNSGPMILLRDKVSDRIADSRSGSMDLAADIAAQTMWLDYFSAADYWRWVSSTVDLFTSTGSQLILRVGTAALEARVYSVAVDIAVDVVRTPELSASHLVSLAHDREFVERETARSSVVGGHLGRSPGDAMLRFSDFVERIESGTTAPP